jgi:ABC-type transporter Mla subunit MlaD
MLTFIFLFVIAVLVVGGIFIALQAKRRSGTGGTKVTVPGDNRPTVQRATPDND